MMLCLLSVPLDCSCHRTLHLPSPVVVRLARTAIHQEHRRSDDRTFQRGSNRPVALGTSDRHLIRVAR